MPKIITPRYETLSEIFKVAKLKIADHHLSIRELHENTDIPEELLAIFLDDSNEVVNDLSRLFKFLKFGFMFNELVFRHHLISYSKSRTQLKITRLIQPRCTVYYDKGTQEFYKFNMTIKSNKASKMRKEILLNEMALFVENFLKKNPD